MKTNYTIVNDVIKLTITYSPTIIAELKKVGGKWNPLEKVWELPLTRLDFVEANIGKLDSKVVKAQVTYEQAESVENEYKMGFYKIACRENRDSNAHLTAILIRGTIPSTGGSVKNPRVSASEDSIFEIECYEDFAIAHNLTISQTAQPAETKGELLLKKERLLKELNEIEQKLALI